MLYFKKNKKATILYILIHLILDQSDHYGKMTFLMISLGKCPIYSATGKLDARICHATLSRECPTNVYKSNLNFNCKSHHNLQT